MKVVNGRLAIAAGVVITLAGILAFSLLSPGMTLGEETDVGLPTDVDDGPADPPASIPDDPDATGPDATGPDASGPDAAPPAALPDTGSGPAGGSNEWSLLLLTALVMAAGVAISGAGMVAGRQARRARQ